MIPLHHISEQDPEDSMLDFSAILAWMALSMAVWYSVECSRSLLHNPEISWLLAQLYQSFISQLVTSDV